MPLAGNGAKPAIPNIIRGTRKQDNEVKAQEEAAVEGC
jgi:hypothetical protein